MVLHLIMNSHLDPVWLWDKGQGIDEVLNTARTACDLLDDYPTLHITRGEAWFYEIVENYDKMLFQRISAHVAAGRWHIVGGWYVQPDCNLGSPETYLKHGEIGCKYFLEKFGMPVQTGYNVDSFGHSAYLPSFYAAAGIQNYIFMRPMEHEKHMPYHTFYWEAPDGKRVLASRILSSYATWDNVDSQIQEVIAQAGSMYNDVMCFVGFGDHGGGPIRKEIDYLLEHWNDFPGVELKFSHPDAYFDAIRKSGVEIPVYKGDLQHHAIGCYAACSKIKREIRKTENTLLQLQRYMTAKNRDFAWKQLLFATFHDSHAGTCIKSAYDEIYDELGTARKLALDAFTAKSRKEMAKLPGSKRQRLLLFNTGNQPLHDLIPIEPPLRPPFFRETPYVSFYDESGNAVPAQPLVSENSVTGRRCFLLKVDVPPHSMLPYELDYKIPHVKSGSVKTDECGTVSSQKLSLSLTANGIENVSFGKKNFFAEPPKVLVFEDKSDTWSHNMKGYFNPPCDEFRFTEDDWTLICLGDLLTEYGRHSKDSDGNRLDWRCGVLSGIPGIRLRLRLGWLSAQKIVKLCFKPTFKPVKRIDGIPGGELERNFDGEEYPIFNRISIYGAKKGESLTFICPDIFSASVSPDGTVSLTLIRSPYYAHHIPAEPTSFSYTGVTESGELDFNIAIVPNASTEDIAEAVYRSTNPLYVCSATKGIDIL